MSIPFTVVFRQVARSPSLEEVARRRFEKLERFNSSIIEGRLVVERPDKHQRKRGESRYQLRLTVSLPGEDIVVGYRPKASTRVGTRPQAVRASDSNGDSMPATVAVGRTFDAARRRLRDRAQRLRGD